jgi:hypothetical protein
MKRTLIIAIAATGLALAGPVAAHHMAPDEVRDAIAERMPENALEAHNDAVENLLEMDVADMGASSTPDRNGRNGTVNGDLAGDGEMDPANDGQGNTCAVIVDGVCDDGMNGDGYGAGMVRSPSTFED